MKKLFLPLFVALFVSGCATSSHVVTGTVRPAISPDGVKVYSTRPAAAEDVAIVSADSINGLTWQQAQNDAVRRLKSQAAKLGANAIVITGTENDVWSGSKATAQAVFVP